MTIFRCYYPRHSGPERAQDVTAETAQNAASQYADDCNWTDTEAAISSGPQQIIVTGLDGIARTFEVTARKSVVYDAYEI
jgi:hypothetical protein